MKVLKIVRGFNVFLNLSLNLYTRIFVILLYASVYINVTNADFK